MLKKAKQTKLELIIKRKKKKLKVSVRTEGRDAVELGVFENRLDKLWDFS